MVWEGDVYTTLSKQVYKANTIAKGHAEKQLRREEETTTINMITEAKEITIIPQSKNKIVGK